MPTFPYLRHARGLWPAGHLAALVFCLGACADQDTASSDADATAIRKFFISAATIEGLNRSLESVKPPVEELFPSDPLRPEDYLKPMSCLGFYGPIGPWGPLGLLGPVGKASWNPSVYVSGSSAVAWSDWAEELADSRGALDVDGPLGSRGPLGRSYWEELPSINDFGKQLQAGGVWTVLGPVGPLGPLGPLGALGPIGAHGFSTDDLGNYLDDAGELVRTVDVPWDEDETRTYELFEQYEEEYALSLSDNDTSFMVSGGTSNQDEYQLVSSSAQFVTVAVVPESASMFLPQAMGVLFAAASIGYDEPVVAPISSLTTDDFDLELLDESGKVVAASASRKFPDWIQMVVPKGKVLRARVSLHSTWDTFGASRISGRYRLIVTGSTKHIGKTDIRGDHQIKL
jgi:hypothetical protein